MDKYLFNGNLLPLCPCGASETLWALLVGKILSFFPFCLFYWSQWEKKKTQSNTSQPRPELTQVTPLSADSLRFCRSVEPVLGGSVALSCPRGRPHHREVDRCLQKDVVWTFQYNSASLFPVDKKKKGGHLMSWLSRHVARDAARDTSPFFCCPTFGSPLLNIRVLDMCLKRGWVIFSCL